MIRKHKECAKKGQLVQTNLWEWAEDGEWSGEKKRKINEINPFSSSPSLSPSLKCKCGLLVSYLCPKSASRKISWPSAAPYIGLSSHTHTHAHIRLQEGRGKLQLTAWWLCNDCDAKWCPYSVGHLATTYVTFTCDHGFLQALVWIMVRGLDVAIDIHIGMDEKMGWQIQRFINRLRGS